MYDVKELPNDDEVNKWGDKGLGDDCFVVPPSTLSSLPWLTSTTTTGYYTESSEGPCQYCQTNIESVYNTIEISLNTDEVSPGCGPTPYFDFARLQFCTEGVSQVTLTFYDAIVDDGGYVTGETERDPVTVSYSYRHSLLLLTESTKQ